MSSKVQCYLRALRLQWGLTQEELAALLPKASRNRVSFVERGLRLPNAEEILAYRLIFGLGVHDVFRRYCSDVDEIVMRRAYRMHQKLKSDGRPIAGRKRELLEQLRTRAMSNVYRRGV
jgi:transcriptional regulator with XRE-family HTH domain